MICFDAGVREACAVDITTVYSLRTFYMVYEEKCYPKSQIVYLANYVVALSAMTDKSQSHEVFSCPSAD